jgi:hypothetical protein
MRFLNQVIFAVCTAMLISCVGKPQQKETETAAPAQEQQRIEVDGKLYQSEQFADLRVLHYYIPQWDSL